jgi:hypothetical protein
LFPKGPILNNTRVPQLLPGYDLPEVGPLEEFYITMPELPPHTVVLEHIANGPSSTPKRRKAPLWARLCVWAGIVFLLLSGLYLVALGAWMRFS